MIKEILDLFWNKSQLLKKEGEIICREMLKEKNGYFKIPYVADNIITIYIDFEETAKECRLLELRLEDDKIIGKVKSYVDNNYIIERCLNNERFIDWYRIMFALSLTNDDEFFDLE